MKIYGCIVIIAALTACGQGRKSSPHNPVSPVAMVADQVIEPTPSPTPTPTPSPDPGQTDQDDQIPVVSSGSKTPAQNASQNDCLPTDKIPCVSLF